MRPFSTGEMEIQTMVRAQTRAMSCCWRPDLSQRPQRREMHPKKAVESDTSGITMSLVISFRWNGM